MSTIVSVALAMCDVYIHLQASMPRGSAHARLHACSFADMSHFTYLVRHFAVLHFHRRPWTHLGRVRYASQSSWAALWCICRRRRQRTPGWRECSAGHRCVLAWSAHHPHAAVTCCSHSRTNASTHPAAAAAVDDDADAGWFPLMTTPTVSRVHYTLSTSNITQYTRNSAATEMMRRSIV